MYSLSEYSPHKGNGESEQFTVTVIMNLKMSHNHCGPDLMDFKWSLTFKIWLCLQQPPKKLLRKELHFQGDDNYNNL